MALISQIEEAVRAVRPPTGSQAIDGADVSPVYDYTDDVPDATVYMKRLGNRHECAGMACTDPKHIDDVAVTNLALIMIGLADDPYPSVARPKELSTATPIEGKRAKARRLKREAAPRLDWAWTEDAACASTDPELFFPPDGEQRVAREIREARAKRICDGCPVQDACFETAVAGFYTGVWGHSDDNGRANERRRRSRRANAA